MKYFLICSCLFAIYFADAQSTTLKIADSFYNGKRYFEASVWYERCLYEEESSYIRVEAINGKLNCLKEQQLFNEALDFVTTCVAMNISDSLRPEFIYQVNLRMLRLLLHNMHPLLPIKECLIKYIY